MNKIKKNWLSIVLVIALLGTGYIIYQDKEEIESLEYKVERLESDIDGLEIKVNEVEDGLSDLKYRLNTGQY